MKRGFTLVELSIVLVIIGLLIGGILVARSMIGTTKIQAQIRQIQQFDAAITNFQTRFGQLPGDTKLFGSHLQDPESIANNNGIIEFSSDDSGSSYSGYPQFSGESAQFWWQLQSGVSIYKDYYFSDLYLCDGGGGPCIYTPDNANMPPAAINNKTGIMVGYDTDLWGSNFNAYIIALFDINADLEESTPIFPCTDLAALDTKMDNGLPNTGNIWGSPCDNGSNKYLTGPSDLSGGIQIKILSQTGNY